MLVRALAAGLLLGGALAAAPAWADEDEVQQLKPPEVPDTNPPPDLAKVTAGIIDRTNAFRKEEKREPVKANDKLTATAKAFAEYMARTDRYGHTADGTRPADRAKTQGYDYCLVLENIAYAYDSRGFDADKMTGTFVTGWKESPGHRKNMLDPDATETGVAVARSETTGHYYAVQMFGRPKADAVVFKIDNRSGETFVYTVGEQTFELLPRYVRTHTVCRPPAVSFAGPTADKPETVTPKAGATLVVTKAGGAWAVKPE